MTIEVITHDGPFHADEVFGVAILDMHYQTVPVVHRTRDPLQWAQVREYAHKRGVPVFMLDVGRECRPEEGLFDHHQPEGAGARPNGIPYATAGLLWRSYGTIIMRRMGARNPEAAALAVDTKLFAAIDAADCGFALSNGKSELDLGVRALNLSGLIGLHNPPWDAQDRTHVRRCFEGTCGLARRILHLMIDSVLSEETAEDGVRKALASRKDPRIVELPRFMPWQATVSKDPDALFVVFPADDRKWNVQCVQGDEPYSKRAPLPVTWAGLDGAKLAEVSGVEDAVFCHRGRFICGARSREGALRLAELALPALSATQT